MHSLLYEQTLKLSIAFLYFFILKKIYIFVLEITRDSAGSELEMYSDEDYDSGRGRMGRRAGNIPIKTVSSSHSDCQAKIS